MADEKLKPHKAEKAIQAFRDDIFVRAGLNGDIVYSFDKKQWALNVNGMLKNKIAEVTERTERGKKYYDVRMTQKEHDEYFRNKEITVIKKNIFAGIFNNNGLPALISQVRNWWNVD